MYMICVSINQIANKYGLYIRYIHNISINPGGVLSKKRHLDRLRSHYEPHRIQGEQLFSRCKKGKMDEHPGVNISSFVKPRDYSWMGFLLFFIFERKWGYSAEKNPMIRSPTLPWSSYVFGAIKTIQLDVTMFFVLAKLPPKSLEHSVKLWISPMELLESSACLFFCCKFWVQGLVDSLENSLSFWTWNLLWVS